MVFTIYGTWRRVAFEKLMMKIYDFFFIQLSRLVALYNWKIFNILMAQIICSTRRPVEFLLDVRVCHMCQNVESS